MKLNDANSVSLPYHPLGYMLLTPLFGSNQIVVDELQHHIDVHDDEIVVLVHH